eukprot:scaffold175132_cov65-Attheya_sp.AAC.2
MVPATIQQPHRITAFLLDHHEQSQFGHPYCCSSILVSWMQEERHHPRLARPLGSQRGQQSCCIIEV